MKYNDVIKKIDNLFEKWMYYPYEYKICQFYIDFVGYQFDRFDDIQCEECSDMLSLVKFDFLETAIYDVQNLIEILDNNHKDYKLFVELKTEFENIFNEL